MKVITLRKIVPHKCCLPSSNINAKNNFYTDTFFNQRHTFSGTVCKVYWIWTKCNQTRYFTTYLNPFLFGEHRSIMNFFQLAQFWAIFSASFQDVLVSLSSATTNLLQLFLGLLGFLFPCGFQVKACLVVLQGGFLMMCSIQPHLLCLICISICSCWETAIWDVLLAWYIVRMFLALFLLVCLIVRRGVSWTTSFQLALSSVMLVGDTFHF